MRMSTQICALLSIHWFTVCFKQEKLQVVSDTNISVWRNCFYSATQWWIFFCRLISDLSYFLFVHQCFACVTGWTLSGHTYRVNASPPRRLPPFWRTTVFQCSKLKEILFLFLVSCDCGWWSFLPFIRPPVRHVFSQQYSRLPLVQSRCHVRQQTNRQSSAWPLTFDPKLLV